MGWLVFVAFVVTFYCLARRAVLRLEAQGRGFLFRTFVGWVIAGCVWLYRQTLFPSTPNSVDTQAGTDGA